VLELAPESAGVAGDLLDRPAARLAHVAASSAPPPAADHGPRTAEPGEVRVGDEGGQRGQAQHRACEEGHDHHPGAHGGTV